MSATAPAPELNPNDNNAYLVYIPSAVFVVICPVLMAFRIWARLRNGGKLGADDWTAILALIFTLLTSGFLVASCQYGMGRHWATLNKHEKFETNKYFYMAQVTYKAAINLVKCCILLLYLRLFHVVQWFRLSCWALLAAVAMYCTASITATIFQCRPIARAFDKDDNPGTCIDTAKFWFANAGFSIATDVIILLLPMPLVWRLEVPTAQKAALAAVFAVGIFVVVTSCLRATTLDLFATSPDNTYNIANVMWTIVEPNVAVVCSCLPILRPFVMGIIPALRSRRGAGSRGLPSYGNGSAGTGTGTGAQKSRATQGSRSRSDGMGGGRGGGDWVELGGVAAARGGLRRPNSLTGSEEDMLAGTKGAVEVGGRGIHKTVEYSVQYSEEQQ
ncbi:5474e185-1129-4d11-b517-b18ce72ecf75 [Thermothielavioides terrestris]|uniref:5474e185-1129-4d11-b517-b18ce72ecf75 n=1 Tax=Thermothielavioides terrestris TaxID=2587410 RepID=A0A3S4AHS4_9PEZI|nr:5474e185-1129-4d11-b517-b18ce72ecf75 [Thermothielavioides terrestris]